MTPLLLIDTQARQVRRVINRQLGALHTFDAEADTLLGDLENFRVSGDAEKQQSEIPDDPAALV